MQAGGVTCAGTRISVQMIREWRPEQTRYRYNLRLNPEHSFAYVDQQGDSRPDISLMLFCARSSRITIHMQ